jgi:hypothetical protein
MLVCHPSDGPYGRGSDMSSKLALKLGVAVSGALLAGVMVAGPASAFHCYVADKPAGAGAATFDDIKPAGDSGNFIVTGAFIAGSEIGTEEDVFIRGQQVDEGIQGLGSLPAQPHDNGSEDHGVNALEE